MKKTYPLHVEGKHPERLLESIKHDIKKYMRRESKKPLPAGFDFWDFDVRIGQNEGDSQAVHPKAINACINEIVKAQPTAFYIELLAKASKRQLKPKPLSLEASHDIEDLEGSGHLSQGPIGTQHAEAQEVQDTVLSKSLDLGH
jgi:Family of unknown function (DUF6172)